MNSPEFLPLAIIGRGCHLPQAGSLTEYWGVIQNDLPTIGEVPLARFDRDLLYDPQPGTELKSYCARACLVEHVSSDRRRDLPAAWKQHPELMFQDLLAVTREACQDAGTEAEALSGRRGGVYIGNTRGGPLVGEISFAMAIEQVTKFVDEVAAAGGLERARVARWKQRLIDSVRAEYSWRRAEPLPTLGAAVGALAMLELLGWSGPAFAFNAACASSLQALHAAALALQSGQIDLAVAAGASQFNSDSLQLFSRAGTLSGTDTRPFDDRADGLIIGEGIVVLLLKRLTDAVRDGDRIHGVIRGLGLASDGKGKSLWAPRKEGQCLAIERAYREPVSRRRIQYLEAHATSTQVGDATELEALAESFAELRDLGRRLPIGSVKANIGHTLEAAGLCGLLKVLLCMEHQVIPSHRRIETLNKKIPWQQIPIFVPDENSPWGEDEQGQRWGAVNSFGIGGLNAHVVLQSGNVVEPKPVSVRGGAAARAASQSAMTVLAHPAPVRVAVVGAGCVLPGALNFPAFRQAILESRGSVIEPPVDRWLAGPDSQSSWAQGPLRPRGGFVQGFQYDWKRHKLPPKQIATASPLQFMILEAVDEALRGTGLLESPEKRRRTGVVAATNYGNDFNTQLQIVLRVPEICLRLRNLLRDDQLPGEQADQIAQRFRRLVMEKLPAYVDETGSFTNSSLASRITKTFDLMGGAVALDARFAGSAAALSYCAQQLHLTDNEFMVCVGAQQEMGPGKYEYWHDWGWLPATEAAAADHDGVYPGEGVVAFLLQKLGAAQTPIVRPIAWLHAVDCAAQGDPELTAREVWQRVGEAAANSLDSQASRVVSAAPRFTPVRAACDGALRRGIRLENAQGSEKLQPELQTVVDQFGHQAATSGLVELLAGIALESVRELDTHVKRRV
ncbi:MAG: beta-ketoacyl synthase N-terminal-like domain-containing protein, partial [Planctomycetota bacterium]